MDFRPSSLNYNYTGTPLNSNRITVLIKVNEQLDNPDYILRVEYQQYQYANWLDILDAEDENIKDVYTDGIPYEFYVAPKNLDTLPDGNYSADVILYFGNQPISDPYYIHSVQKLRVMLNINAGTTEFTVTPDSAILHLVKNNPNNPFQNFQAETSFPVSLSGSNLLLANNQPLAFNFDSSQEIKISTAPIVRDLEVGVYDTELEFKDQNNASLKRVPIKVLVTNTNALDVFPRTLQWEINRGIDTAVWKDVLVFDPADNVSITKPSWLEKIDVSSNLGLKNYSFSFNPDDLPNGTTRSEIVFTSGATVIRVQVIINIIGIWDASYDKDFHFTKDSEVLRVNRSTTDPAIVSILKVKMFIKIYDFAGNLTELERTQEVNFYQNIASFDAGKYIHRLFQLPNTLNHNLNYTGTRSQYAFAEIYFNCDEINFKDLSVIRSFVVPTQKYIFGRNPLQYVNNQLTTRNAFLTINPNTTHFVSRKGIVSMAYIKTSGRNPIVKHNDEVIQLPTSITLETANANFNLPTLNIKLFALYIEINKLKDIAVGDVISIEYNGVSQHYIICPEVEHSTNLWYYNQWNVLSVLELRGGYKLEPNYNHSNNIVFKNWTEVEHRLSTAKRQKFFINSGKLMPDTSYVIDEIHHAKRCWMIGKDNQLQEMIITSTKQVITDSSVKDISYELEFELKNKNDDHSFKR